MERVTAITVTLLTDGSNPLSLKLTDIMTRIRNFTRHQLVLVLFLLCANAVKAGDWDIRPRLSVAEIFSDNINLSADDQESELITEITPGISIHGGGKRVTADIDWNMQNLLYLNESDKSNTFHQLNAIAAAEVARDFFFIDATARARQVIIDANDTISDNNVNTTGNRTDTYGYSLSPYILPHFGGWADGSFRYTYSQTKFDTGASDSNTQSFDAGLVSGRKFGPLSWLANYNNTEQTRDTASDATYENADGLARYFISNRFSFVGTAGYANNDFQTSTEIVNGSYWSVGGFWQPNRYASFEAQKGDNLETATVGLYPTRRTSLVVTYRDRKVGLNPGPAWDGSFSHYTRRTSWSASYIEDTTTRQQEVLEDGGVAILGIDPVTGLVNDNPQPGDLVVSVPLPPVTSLTDQVTERKRASGTVGMKLGKTGLRLNVFNEERLLLTTLTEQVTKGISGSVNRRVAPRTNSILTGSWQRRTDDSIDGTDQDYWFLDAQLTRRISPKLRGTLSYTFTKSITTSTSTLNPNRDRGYSENKIVARLTAFF